MLHIVGTSDAHAPVEQNPVPKETEIQWILDEVRAFFPFPRSPNILSHNLLLFLFLSFC